MTPILEGSHDGSHLKIAIVVSRFSGEPCQKLLDGALGRLEELGVASSDIDVAWVPGAFEIAGVATRFLKARNHDAIITLGCVIRGETPHFDHVAGPCADAISRLSSRGRIPVIFGVLTTDNREQAMARCGGKQGNKGSDSAQAAIEMIRLYQQIPREASE